MAAPGELHPLSASQLAQCLFIAGPTAVGKSELALQVGERLGGEIISVDSMQVYRGLEIGTAKPAAEARDRVRHHLIDVADLGESFDAARFVRLAHQAVREIQARGRLPVFCGGTGLYFKALLEGLGEAPPADAELRAQLEATPLAELIAELERRDPATYAVIDRQNPRRVVRALEVIRLTGKKFSVQRATWNPSVNAAVAPTRFFCLTRPMPELQARINARVEVMFAAGLVAETRALLERGLDRNPTALQALGYRQVVEHLRGSIDLVETVELVKIRTRQFARRQLTWFRKHARATWVDISSSPGLQEFMRLATAK